MKISRGNGRVIRTEAFAQVSDASGNVDTIVTMYLSKSRDVTNITGLFKEFKVNSIMARWFPKDPNSTGLYAISAYKSGYVGTAFTNWVDHVEDGDSPIKVGNIAKPFTFRFKNPNKEWRFYPDADGDGELEDYNLYLNIRDGPVSTTIGQMLITMDISLR